MKLDTLNGWQRLFFVLSVTYFILVAIVGLVVISENTSNDKIYTIDEYIEIVKPVIKTVNYKEHQPPKKSTSEEWVEPDLDANKKENNAFLYIRYGDSWEKIGVSYLASNKDGDCLYWMSGLWTPAGKCDAFVYFYGPEKLYETVAEKQFYLIRPYLLLFVIWFVPIVIIYILSLSINWIIKGFKL